jgi:hypothetical protein
MKALAVSLPNGERLCSKCRKAFPLNSENFFRHAERADGFHSWCKPCCKAGSKAALIKAQSTVEGRAKALLYNCTVNAAKRGHICELSVNSFREMWDAQGGLCAYTGREMTLRPGLPDTMSIERIDSSLGYVENNCVLVCLGINRMKSDLAPDTFFEMCRDVVRWLGDDEGNLEIEWRR